MIKNKILLLIFILGLVIFTSSLSAYTIDSINIEEEYNYKDSNPYHIIINITPGDENSINIPLTINSDKQSIAIDFNTQRVDVVGESYNANFYLDFESSSSSWEGGINNDWPKIIVNDTDTITVTDGLGQGIFDTMGVDNISPNIGIFTVSPINTNYNNYYKGDVNLSLSGYSDDINGRYISNFIVYAIKPEYLDTYDSDYDKKLITDNNSTYIPLESSTLSDGNYFIVVDAIDASGNVGFLEDVKNTKQILYADNTEPQVTRFLINGSQKSLSDKSIYYVDSYDFDFTIQLEDSDSGIKNGQLSGFAPDGSYIDTKDFNFEINGFYYDLFTEYLENTYQINFDINDYVNNLSHYDFNIQIDLEPPTIPTEPILDIDIDGNVTISSWGTSIDDASGVKEYKLYRSTSSFTDPLGKILICSVDASDTKSCIDTDEKSDNTQYYYGVSAIDYADNESDVISVSIMTGPELSIDIDTDEDYINYTTPTFNIETSSDVNAIRFSCNGSTFTSWIEINDSSFSYDDFEITTGAGCNSDNEEKTIYLQARDEDDFDRITQKSVNVRYDNIAPNRPTNIDVVSLSNGGIEIKWSESLDNYSGLDYYKIYYSDSPGVTKANEYFIVYNETYTFTSNEDSNYYFALTSFDEAGNESDLTEEVIGKSKRFGPTFSFDISPVNIYNNIIYAKPEILNFVITSDEALKETPTVKYKTNDSSFVYITPSYKNSKTTFSHKFIEDGIVTLFITGKNMSNEEATDTYEFIIDANVPDFNVDYYDDGNIYEINLYNLPEDIFKVQYLLNNSEELAILQDVDNYNKSFDFNTYDDGNYNINILVYDYALNIGQKTISFEIDNIDEKLIKRNNLISSVNSSIRDIGEKLEIYDNLLINISEDFKTKFNSAKNKVTDAQKMIDANNFSSAEELYNEANNLLIEINSSLPTEEIINTKTVSYNFDSNVIDVSKLTYDANIINDTIELYDSNSFSIDRNFSIQQISSQKYYSLSLEFFNTSKTEKQITFIEEIPKDFAIDINSLIFNDKITILEEDPIIMHSVTIAPGDSYVLRYKNKNPITDFDVITKFKQIEFSSPLVLSGDVSFEDINYDLPSNKKLYTLLGIGVLFIILILLIVWAFLSASKKNKKNLGKTKNAKNEINDYLGDRYDITPDSMKNKDVNEKTNDIEQEDINKPEQSHITDNDEFKSNYEYIINAVKRNNKK